MNNEQLKALGKVMVNFGSLEFLLNFFIWQLIDRNNIDLGKVVTSENSFRRNIALFASLYRLKIGNIDKDTEIDNLIKKLITAGENRDKVAHSTWLMNKSGENISTYKITAKQKQGLKNRFEDMNVPELEKISKYIGEASGGIFNLIKKHTQNDKIVIS